MGPNWNRFFHFATGMEFRVVGPFGYNGEGRVIENSQERLAFRLDLDPWGPAPGFHGEIDISYAREGAGNVVALNRDGAAEQLDENAIIYSNVRTRERRVSARMITFSMRFDETNELDFDVHLDGVFYPFEFLSKMRIS